MKENKIGWIKIIVIYSDQLAMKPNIATTTKKKKGYGKLNLNIWKHKNKNVDNWLSPQ
jgi:hypothetical protein